MSELIDSAMALPTERITPKTATDDDDAAPKPLNAMSLTACCAGSGGEGESRRRRIDTDADLRLVVEARDDLVREVLERAERARRVVGELPGELRVRELDGLEQRSFEGRALFQLESFSDALALDHKNVVVFIKTVEVRLQSCEDTRAHLFLEARDVLLRPVGHAARPRQLERGRGGPRRPHRVARQAYGEQDAEQHGAQCHINHQPRRRLAVRELGPALVEDPVLDALEAVAQAAQRERDQLRPGERREVGPK